jgi:hypothetical protein
MCPREGNLVQNIEQISRMGRRENASVLEVTLSTYPAFFWDVGSRSVIVKEDSERRNEKMDTKINNRERSCFLPFQPGMSKYQLKSCVEL